MKFLFASFVVCFCAGALVRQALGGTPADAAGGSALEFKAENRTYDQVLQMFHQRTGLEYEAPSEFRKQKLPLVEIKGLSPKAAIMKVLEGSNYDFILIASPGDAEMVTRLIVTGRSVRSGQSAVPAVASARPVVNRRVNRQVVEDPFGGDVDMGFDETNVEPMAVTPVQENPPPQAVVPGQAMPQPAGGVPPQQVPPMQGQPLLQTAPPGQQQQLGQPLGPMTPQQVMPGMNQPTPQGNNPQDRRSPF